MVKYRNEKFAISLEKYILPVQNSYHRTQTVCTLQPYDPDTITPLVKLVNYMDLQFM